MQPHGCHIALAAALLGCSAKDMADADGSSSSSDAETRPDTRPDSDDADTASPEDTGGTADTGSPPTDWPDFFAAADVSTDQMALIRADYQTASAAWGTAQPLEYWIVGTDEAAAEALDVEFCSVRMAHDPLLTEEYRAYCENREYSFVDYARDGGAGLSMHISQDDAYSTMLITLASKNPFPDESDYTAVGYHEYFHAIQVSHIDLVNQDTFEALMLVNPWWTEGGAEYMAQLLYAQQPGVEDGYLKERMSWKMQSRDDLEEGESFTDIPYGERAQIAYDLGAWFNAFVVDRVGETTYRVDFYEDLYELGWEGSFVDNFGVSSEEMLADFEAFLDKPIEEQVDIIP